MKLNQPWITGPMSLPLWLGIRAWMSTLDYRVAYRDETIDPTLHAGPPRLYLFWHEGILTPLYLRGHCHFAMLLSKHRDADFLARIAGRFGFDCVRGSTNRGGARALRELARRSQDTHLTITPDGPRGPARVCASGPIYLASRLGLPVVPMGFGYSNPWRMNSWDRFAVPKPFSRARAVVGEPVTVPTDLDRDGIEAWRRRIEQALNEVHDEADDWAASGAARLDEQRLVRRSAPPPTPRTASAIRKAA